MNERQTGMKGVKMFFGIFMVLVYLGMAYLMAINFFDWTNTPMWNTIRWFFAVLFAAYGLYRGYREVKGKHSYGMRLNEDKDQYATYGDRLKNKSDNDEKV